MQQVPAETVPGRAAIFLASIDADLYRRGAAHHEPAPWPAAIEELLHSRVTRQVEDAAGQPVGIKATADQGKSGRAQGRADGGEITARGGHAVAEGVARRGTQLDLAAGLERQAAVAGQAARRVKGGQALRDLLVRGWPGQVTRVTDQPLELDSYCAGRSGASGAASLCVACWWGAGRVRSRGSQTSHSSSTPTAPGGPVLKQMPCTHCSASRSDSGGATWSSLRRRCIIGFPVDVLQNRAQTCQRSCEHSHSRVS